MIANQAYTLYNIVNETVSTKKYLGCTKQTFVGNPQDSYSDSLASIVYRKSRRMAFHTITSKYPDIANFVQEVKPVAVFRVKKLHNHDPITII